MMSGLDDSFLLQMALKNFGDLIIYQCMLQLVGDQSPINCWWATVYRLTCTKSLTGRSKVAKFKSIDVDNQQLLEALSNQSAIKSSYRSLLIMFKRLAVTHFDWWPCGNHVATFIKPYCDIGNLSVRLWLSFFQSWRAQVMVTSSMGPGLTV